MSLKKMIQDKKIAAMKSGAKFERDTLTSILSKIKQYEVDNKADLSTNDTTVLVIIDKMIKERKDSISLFRKAERHDLVEKETNEIIVISDFLPEQLSESEIIELVNNAIETIKPESMKDMGKVMAFLKPKIQGRGDMSIVSSLIKKSMTHV